jgi:hypothetical protein
VSGKAMNYTGNDQQNGRKEESERISSPMKKE